MKRNLKIALITALTATILFASCNKNRENESIEKRGEPTFMSVSISFPNEPQTRSTGDVNATDNEAEVNTVDIFIYYTNSGAFESHTHLKGNDFNAAGFNGEADIYISKAEAKIKTTTGAKTVFAGINLPTTLVDAIKSKPASELTNVVRTFTPDQLTSAGGFVMFSSEGFSSTFVTDENSQLNKVTLKCQRLVAKITVETASTLHVAELPVTLYLDNLVFAVNNVNKKAFLIQGKAPEYKDPNWANGSYNKEDFILVDINKPVAGEFAPVLDRKAKPSPAIGEYTPLYALENTSEGKIKREITRVSVRADFVPKAILEYKNGANNEEGYAKNTSPAIERLTDIYTVTPSVTEGMFFFVNENVANDFADDNGGDVILYKNGYCYWNIYLGKTNDPANQWDVLRNDYYKCNITHILALGRETPDITEPEDENRPDSETNIRTEIEILFWNTPPVANYVLD